MRYNNIKKRWEKGFNLERGIVYVDQNYVEFGYFERDYLSIPILFQGSLVYLDRLEHCSMPLYWMGNNGCYSLERADENNLIIDSKENFYYPIQRCYNFSKVNIVESPVDIIPDEEYVYIKLFTLGLEYETSAGNIPWLNCLKYNLVPLYDGSIRGHEYVTFPLTYDKLPLINYHLKLLKKHTYYNKNCSLHIHFGNFPISYDKIERLCKFWSKFQWEIGNYVPTWSYYTENYKSNGKDYNKPLNVRKLVSFYKQTTGNTYIDDNSFYLPNLNDVNEERKWQVQGRYFNLNIMHLISGNEHKTVEFRFLRPTFNYSEIKWYILVLGAFLNYIISSDDNQYSKLTVPKIIYHTFPEKIADKLVCEGKKLYTLRKMQMNYGDPAGIDTLKKNYLLDKLYKFKL